MSLKPGNRPHCGRGVRQCVGRNGRDRFGALSGDGERGVDSGGVVVGEIADQLIPAQGQSHAHSA
jgi:hypothetical protein